MTHAQLVEKAVAWLRAYRCGVVLSGAGLRQRRDARRHRMEARLPFRAGRMQNLRADFLADRDKPFRRSSPTSGWAASASISPRRDCWNRRNCRRAGDCSKSASAKSRWSQVARATSALLPGFAYEMNLLLASLRRVEIRIEPQTITDFLKWKNRMQQYNGGAFPEGLEPTQEEHNYFPGNRSRLRNRLFPG